MNTSTTSTPSGTASGGTVPVVAQFRARPEVIALAPADAPDVRHLRVELPDVWDVVRIDVAPSDTIRTIKIHALQTLAPGALFHDEYVIKWRGKEIFDEMQSVQAAGVPDGAALLLARRRRRPVR